MRHLWSKFNHRIRLMRIIQAKSKINMLVVQLLSSLVSMQNEDFGTVCHKKLFMKNWFNF